MRSSIVRSIKLIFPALIAFAPVRLALGQEPPLPASAQPPTPTQPPAAAPAPTDEAV